MNKKNHNPIRKFLVGMALAGLILSLCLGSGGAPAVRAQGQQPPQPTQPPQPPSYPPAFPFGVDGQNAGSSPSGQTQSGASPASIALGASGLSFRYLQTFGVTDEAYPADVQHINNPAAVFIDGSDNLFVVESNGERVLKYSTSERRMMLQQMAMEISG